MDTQEKRARRIYKLLKENAPYVYNMFAYKKMLKKSSEGTNQTGTAPKTPSDS